MIALPAAAMDLNGIAPGMTLGQVRKTFAPFRCITVPEGAPHAGCNYDPPPPGMKDAPWNVPALNAYARFPTTTVAFGFAGETLDSVSFSFEREHLGELEAVLRGRFGRPASARSSMGGREGRAGMPVVDLTWESGGQQLTLRDYSVGRVTLELKKRD